MSVSSDRADAVTVDHGLALIRVAAVLVHWIPDVECRVVQPDIPPLHVTTREGDASGDDVRLHPCEFRRMVLQMLNAREAGPSRLIDTAVHLDVEMLAESRSTVGPLGMVRHELADGHGIIAFAQLSGHATSSMATATDGVDVRFDDDRELGVTLVHAHFADPASEQRLFDLLFGLAAAGVVERLASLTARPPGP